MVSEEEFGSLLSEYDAFKDAIKEEVAKLKEQIENLKEDIKDLRNAIEERN